MKQKSGAIRNILYPVLALALFVCIWWIAALVMDVALILPTPAEAVKSLFALFSEGWYYRAVVDTLLRTLSGFGVSLALALALSVLAFLVKPFAKLFAPLVLILRSVPTMSVILLVLIWMGSKTAPVLIASLVSFPMLYAVFYGALTETDRDNAEMSKVYRVPVKKRVMCLYLPSMLPQVFSASQSGISLMLKVLIAAEAIAQTGSSIGGMMQLSKIYLETGQLMAWTLTAILLSFLLELAVGGLRRLVIRWERRA